VLLLDRERRLVKTRRLCEQIYVGDPFNVLRIFNEKEVDEICVLDIHATEDDRAPDLEFIRTLASECFMPLGYGGGVRTIAHCERLFSLGVEKVVIGASAPHGELVRGAAREFGSQAVAVSVDVTRNAGRLEVRTHRGRRVVSNDPVEYARRMADDGAGEILLHSIDRDGCRHGYDLETLAAVASGVTVPVVALGGAGHYSHFREGLTAGASAVASGSAFVFLGPLRAVLLSYPTDSEIEQHIVADNGGAQ
jgi:cyclase